MEGLTVDEYLARSGAGESSLNTYRKLLTQCEKLILFFFSSRRRHTRSVSAFLLNRSSDLSVDRFVIVSIFIPKLRLILILNSFLGSSDSLVFSELFHSLAPRPLAARSISDFLLTYLAT